MSEGIPPGPEGRLGSIFDDMMVLRDSLSARASSWDRSGANKDFRCLPAGGTLDLADIPGAGCIRHLYFTITISPHSFGNPRYLRDLVLRAYWDQEDTPSVEVPFGDMFGQGHECIRFFRSLLVTVNEGMELIGGKTGTITVGFNAYFPMPFADGARLTLANEGDYDVASVWYHVDYEQVPHIDPCVGRFHAQWRRQNPAPAVGEVVNSAHSNAANLDGHDNYVILDAHGHGNFVGYFLNVHNFFDDWYGEGDDMIFIDGDTWPPSIHGTGTEECFGGGACPNVEYAGPYTGFHLIGNKNWIGKTSMYRFHVADPVRFKESIRVTIEHGHANNFANDYSSTAFWYQAEPHAPFPALLPVEERRPVVGDDPHDLAHAAFLKLQTNHAAYRAVLRADKVGPDADLERDVFERLASDIAAAFAAKDYVLVGEKCAEANAKLEVFVAQNVE